MADVFDVSSIEQATLLFEQGSIHAKSTAEQTERIKQAMQEVAQIRAQIPELSIIDPKLAQAAVAAAKKMEQSIIAQGGELKELLKYRRQEAELVGAEVVKWDQLTRKARRRVKEEQRKVEFGEKYIKIGNQNVKIKEEELKASRSILKDTQRYGAAVGKWSANMAAIPLTLGGIIKLLIGFKDQLDKIGAMSQQINVQWAAGNKNFSVASSSISKIEQSFIKSLEVAGEYNVSLARAGFEMEDMKRLSKELLAVEYLHGQNVQSQVEGIKNLVTNYNKTSSVAAGYLNTIREASATIPMLSMDEAISDIKELTDKTRSYSADLLGVLGLYNTLISKDVAKKLGLGEAPREVRKEIVKTISGFSSELEDGWKAALGEGSTAASRILQFERLFPEQQFERIGQFIQKHTQQFTGDTREIAVRKLLKQFNFTSEEVQKVMAQAFTRGGLGGEGLAKFAKEVGKAREKMKDAEAEYKKNRNVLVNKGAEIAKKLAGTEARIKKWIETTLRKWFETIFDLMNTIIDIVGGKSTYNVRSGLPAATVRGEKVLEKTIEAKEFSKLYSGKAGASELISAIRSDLTKEEINRYKSVRSALLKNAAPATFRQGAAYEKLGSLARVGGNAAIQELLKAGQTRDRDIILQEVQRILKENQNRERAVKTKEPTSKYAEVG